MERAYLPFTLQSFVEGISKELTAVKNGIIYPYINGLVEGIMDKIKAIKRIMYGRNSFKLLKAKVLFHELFRGEFNEHCKEHNYRFCLKLMQ